MNNFIWSATNYISDSKEQIQQQFHTSGNHGNHTAGKASSRDASRLVSLSPRDNFS